MPPLPRRGKPVESGPLNDQYGVLYAQLKKHSSKPQRSCQDNFPGDYPGRAERPTALARTCQKENISRRRPDSGSDAVYSELSLLDFKSRSLPLLDDSSDEKQSYRLSASCLTPPKLSPKPLRQAASTGPSSHSRPSSIHSLDHPCNSPVYHLAGSPGSPHVAPEIRTFTSEQSGDWLYAEVSTGAAAAGNFSCENTYEQIPGHEGPDRPKPTCNTYELLEDFRPKHVLSSWGIKVSDAVTFQRNSAQLLQSCFI